MVGGGRETRRGFPSISEPVLFLWWMTDGLPTGSTLMGLGCDSSSTRFNQFWYFDNWLTTFIRYFRSKKPAKRKFSQTTLRTAHLITCENFQFEATIFQKYGIYLSQQLSVTYVIRSICYLRRLLSVKFAAYNSCYFWHLQSATFGSNRNRIFWSYEVIGSPYRTKRGRSPSTMTLNWGSPESLICTALSAMQCMAWIVQ